MASSFSDSLMASAGVEAPLKIPKSTKGMTMKFLPDVVIQKEACKVQNKFRKTLFLKTQI